MIIEYLDRVQRENNLLCLRMARTDRPTISFSNLNPLFLASRLGDRKRAQEKKRIDEQNLVRLKKLCLKTIILTPKKKMFIQRIEDQKAYYQKTQWKKDRTQNLAYLSNISRFPEVYTSSISPSPPQSKTSNKPPASPRHKHYDTTKMTDKFKPETVQKLVGDGKIRVGMTRAVLLRVEFLEKKKKKDEEEVGSRRAVPWLDSHAVAA